MKRILILVLCLLLATSASAGQITKKHTFSSGSTISSADVNENFDDLFTLVDGNIEGGSSGNIAADTLTEREMADDINPRIRWDEGFEDFTPTGLQPATSASLTSNISAGTAYVEGYRVNKASATSHTYTASKATYVDISKTGVFTYTETAIGAAAPALTANSTRTAVVETSGSAITNVTDLRTLTPYVSTSVTVQVVNTQTATAATGTTVLPFDGSIPQSNEGDQYMSLAITPTSATNKLKIDVVFNGAHSGADRYFIALFQDATADALGAWEANPSAVNYMGTTTFSYYMTAGTTAETTFKIRAGNGVGATTTFNGATGANVLGGKEYSSITITEILV